MAKVRLAFVMMLLVRLLSGLYRTLRETLSGVSCFVIAACVCVGMCGCRCVCAGGGGYVCVCVCMCVCVCVYVCVYQ